MRIEINVMLSGCCNLATTLNVVIPSVDRTNAVAPPIPTFQTFIQY